MYLECGAQEVAIRFLHAKFKFSNETADRCDLLRMPKSAAPLEEARGAAFINRGSSCGLEPEVLSPNSLQWDSSRSSLH